MQFITLRGGVDMKQQAEDCCQVSVVVHLRCVRILGRRLRNRDAFLSLSPRRRSRGAGERLAQVLVVGFQQQNEPDPGQIQSQSQEF